MCSPNFTHPTQCVCRDAAYRGPMYQGLAEGNATKYLTLEKDLGGFNNIRMSLETGVALAAAMGRTFVIPPPFPIWRMNTKSGKKVRVLFWSPRVSLRNLVQMTARQHYHYYFLSVNSRPAVCCRTGPVDTTISKATFRSVRTPYCSSIAQHSIHAS